MRVPLNNGNEEVLNVFTDEKTREINEKKIKEVYVDSNNSERIGSEEYYRKTDIINKFVDLFFSELYIDPTPNNPTMSVMVLKMLNMIDCLGKELYEKEVKE